MSSPCERGFGSLRFGSCFAYGPHADGPVAAIARHLCAQVKSADPASLARLAPHVVHASRQGGALEGFFGRDVALIPVPGSGIGCSRPWVAARLAHVLRQCGLGACVWPVLQRRSPVPRSATAGPGKRPDCRLHRLSFAVAQLRPVTARVLLVDDVITKGRTLLAAADCLQSTFPCLTVEAFALVRTLGRGAPVVMPLQPCRGWIEWTGNDARRSP